MGAAEPAVRNRRPRERVDDEPGVVRSDPRAIYDGVCQRLARAISEVVSRIEAGWVSRVAGTDAADLLGRWDVGSGVTDSAVVDEYGTGSWQVWEGGEYSAFDEGVDGGCGVRGCGGEDLSDPAGTMAEG